VQIVAPSRVTVRMHGDDGSNMDTALALWARAVSVSLVHLSLIRVQGREFCTQNGAMLLLFYEFYRANSCLGRQ
jgi:hypothetical protein